MGGNQLFLFFFFFPFSIQFFFWLTMKCSNALPFMWNAQRLDSESKGGGKLVTKA